MAQKRLRWGVPPAPAKPTILVVEDDAALRRLYRAALQGAGYPVVAVEDGLDALHCIDGQRPGAVVLDLALPRVAGRDVQRELAARPETSRIPIVVVSGGDTSDINPNDVACVLRKPVTAETMVSAVESSLRSPRVSRNFS